MSADSGRAGATPARPVRVVLVEDVEDDALLTVAALEDAGLTVQHLRVDSAQALTAALADQEWDVVLSDHGLPGWDVFGVLETVAAADQDLPCIVVSGAIGEEAAVAAMRAGAEDFVPKNDLSRLAPAVERAMREAAQRHAGRLAREEVYRSEERLQALLRHTADGVVVIGPAGESRYCSPGVARLLGPTQGFPVRISADDVPGRGEVVIPQARYHDLLAHPERTVEFDAVGTTTDGEPRRFRLVASNVLDDPAVGGVIVSIRDVTDSHRADEEIRRQAELNRAVLDSLPAEVAVVDSRGRVQAANPAWRDRSQAAGAEFFPPVGSTYFEGSPAPVAGGVWQQVRDGLASALAGDRRFVADVQLPGLEPDGWRMLSIDPLAGGQGAVVSYTDINARKRFEAELADRALRDPLTGLPNRLLLNDRLRQALAAMRRGGGPVAVVFADLDGFKLVNDSLSHAAGDRLLVAVAKRLSASCRAVDTVTRFGGDEFAFLLADVGSEVTAAPVLDRLHAAMREPFEVDGRRVVVSLSMGVVFATDPDVDPDALIADADAAMYVAKQQGRARHVVFDDGLRTRALARLEMQAALRDALAGDELVVHYQPLVQLGERRVVGFEALVRWQRPGHGLVPPMDFVPVAEESGLIVPMGRQVLDRAWAQLAGWLAENPRLPWSMSVNLSARQLTAAGFVEEVSALLDRVDIDPDRLVLEITESVLMRDDAATRSAVHALKDLGVRLHIDDFGTGYSSLAYLKRLPVDGLKIDRCFVRDIAGDAGDAAIATAIVGIADTLGLDVVAEGVETEDQVAVLAGLGCEVGQGYGFAPPIPAPDVLPRVREIER